MISPTAGLRARVLHGLAWKATSQIVMQLTRVAVAVVLARLLAPRDYGLAGMVLVFSSLVLAFSDLALGAALVQRRTLTEKDRSTVFWTGVSAGAFFTVAGLLASEPLARFYGEPEVAPLFAALSLSFFVTSLGTTQNALLIREMSFRAVELCWMAATISGATIGIAAALHGYGAWAIIAQQLTIAVIGTSLLWLASSWRPRFAFSRASLRDLGGFGANVFGQRLLYYLHRNADNLLVGRFLGAAPLGAYAVAYNVMLVPFSRIAGPIQEVLFPAFARMQDDRERMARIWIRSTRMVAAVSAPALLGMIVVAPDFVQVVLGEKWKAAGPVLQVLAWVGLLQSLQTLNGDILMALDRTSTLLRYSVLNFCCNFVGFVVGLHWGIVGVAAGYAVTSTVIEPFFAWLTARALGTSLRAYLHGISGVAQAGFAMLVCVFAARLVLVDAGVGAGSRLALLVLLGAAVYIPCCAWRAPEVVAELRQLRSRRATTAEGVDPTPETGA